MISFVIPVRDDAERLQKCLRRIAEGTPAGVTVEVVVADNGSTDGSADVARKAGAIVLDLPGARLGELRNRGAARATRPVLAFVDADHEIAPGWIPAALETLASTAIGAVGAPCHPPSPATWVQRLHDRLRRHPAAQERVDWLGSGNMAVRRAAFDEVGGFDITLETCEDVDLCRKLRRQGYVLLADRRLENVHHGDPQTLRQVFFGELWRGRDNVRVSLRPPLSVRTLLSAVVPIATLGALGLVVAGIAVRSTTGALLAAAAGGFLMLLPALRALIMVRGAGMEAGAWGGEWLRAVAVAAAYEAGRALALTGRFGHARRRAAEVSP